LITFLGFGVEDETALEDKRLAVIGDEAACAGRNMFAGEMAPVAADGLGLAD
jgi:hypothetical protein